MDNEQILHKLHALAVLLVVHQEDIEDLLGDVVIAAMQRIVESFGDFVEIVAASNDLPFGHHFQLVEQRDEPVKDFRHAAAHRG